MKISLLILIGMYFYNVFLLLWNRAADWFKSVQSTNSIGQCTKYRSDSYANYPCLHVAFLLVQLLKWWRKICRDISNKLESSNSYVRKPP